MVARISKSKKKPARRKRPVGNRTNRRGRGPERGAKYGPKAKRGVTVDVRAITAAARDEVRGLIDGALGLDRAACRAIEREWVGLVVRHSRVAALIAAGVDTTHDQAEQRRCEARLAKIRAELTARPDVPVDLEPLDTSNRRAFCEAHLTVADGGRFTLDGREWQEAEFWGPLEGFRLWPVTRKALCSSCAARAGAIVPSAYAADETRTEEHAATGCRGLHAHVIWLVALQLKRQQGKTTGVAGYTVWAMFRYAKQAIAYLAGSEDQSERLCRANFGKPVTESPGLKDRVNVMRTRMLVPETGSEFALFPASLAGTTGGTWSLVIVDEARDVPGPVFSAFVPTIYARNGWRCPSGKPGHAWSSGDLVLLEEYNGTAIDPTQERYGQTCTTCGATVEPWTGRVVAMSSAQELDGSDDDWFNDLCDSLEAEPQPDAHVYRSAHVVNPKVSRQIVSRTEAVLGRVKGLSDSMAIEAGGVSKRKGEPWISDSQINAILDRTLRNEEAGKRPAVGFLDTSETTELTSLVILEDEGLEDEPPWHRLVQTRMDLWVPAEQRGGIIDEAVVEAHVRAIVPLFGLLELRIDDRLRPWAKALLRRLKHDAPFKRIVRGCDTGDDRWQGPDRMLAWEKFEERIAAQTIRLIGDPKHRGTAILREELKTARRVPHLQGGVDVREQSRKKRHLDIAEGIACCCRMAHDLSVKRKRLSLSDIERKNRGGARSRLSALRSHRDRGRYRGGEDY